MPPTSGEGDRDLSIQLADTGIPFYPGSVIRGHVIRKSPLVAASATILIRLKGRAKAKITIHVGNSQSYYRSRVQFWPAGTVSELLHQGPVHIAPGPDVEAQKWAFSLALPRCTDTRAVNACFGPGQAKASFLHAPDDPKGRRRLPDQILPASCFHSPAKYSSPGWHGFVEYWLEAEMHVKGKRQSSFCAKTPVRVLSLPTTEFITDFQLQRRMMDGCVRSQRLLPGMEDAQLSFKQKTQKLFHSSKVPVFHYTLEVEYPAVIQIGNPDTIPFRLKLTPYRGKSSGAIEHVQHKVHLKRAKLALHSTTGVICPSVFEAHEASETKEVCLIGMRRYKSEVDGIEIPSNANGGAVDIGAVLGVQLDASGRVLGPSSFAAGETEMVVPDYKTYCISVTSMLQWRVELSIAGELWRCGGFQDVTVLPAVGADAPIGTRIPMTLRERHTMDGINQLPRYEGPGFPAPAYRKADEGNGEAPTM